MARETFAAGRRTAIVLVTLLVVAGPFYRYARAALPDAPLLGYAPFLLEAALGFLIFAATIRAPRLLFSSSLDLVLGLFALGVSIAALRAGVTRSPNALLTLRIYASGLVVYFALRVFATPADKRRTVRWGVIAVVASAALLLHEFYLFNLSGRTPDQVYTYSYLYREAAGNTRSLAGYVIPDSYVFPVLGHVIRPFGPLGAPPISGVLYLTALAWALFQENGRTRLVLGGGALAGILLTVSRTAYLLTAILITLWGWSRIRGLAQPRTRRVATIAGLLALGLLIIAFIPATAPLFSEEKASGETGVLGSKLFVKDLRAYVGWVGDALARGAPLDVLVGGEHPSSNGTYLASGALDPLYRSTHPTDTALVDWLIDIGVLPVALIVATLVVSVVTGDPQDSVTRAWWLATVGIILITDLHYSSLFKYSFDVLAYAGLALVASEGSVAIWSR